MNPSDLSRYLSDLIREKINLSVMIWGPPGIGKSSIVAQVAKNSQMDVIDVRLSQLSPTDLRGLPVPERNESGEGISCWFPPEFLPRVGQGILFLDELNMAPPSMQGVAQQLILDRRIGSYTVPEGWYVWAAGNRKEDRSAVFDMPAPLANRFLHLDVASDLEAFKSYAIANEISERIIAFLSFRPDLLLKIDPARPSWPSPRSWFMAARLLKADLAIAPAIGEPAAAEFIGFLQVYDSIPDIKSIMQGSGSSIKPPKELSALYATVIGLALTVRTAKEAVNAFQWLLGATTREWQRLFVQDMLRSTTALGKQGVVAAAIKQEPKLQEFFEDYKQLLLAT